MDINTILEQPTSFFFQWSILDNTIFPWALWWGQHKQSETTQWGTAKIEEKEESYINAMN